MLNSWSLTVQPPATNTYNAQLTRGLTIPTPSARSPSRSNSTINVPDSFPVAGVSVQLNITDANDPDLEAYLIAPDGTTVELFKNVGATGHEGQLHEHGLQRQRDDLDPDRRCPVLRLVPARAGGWLPPVARSRSHWRSDQLQRQMDPASSSTTKSDGIIGTLNSWSLTLRQERVNQRPGRAGRRPGGGSASRSYTTAPTDPQSSTNWTAVGPTSVGNGTSLNGYAGQVSSIAVDPSDPSGNTVYAAGASGGVWKTTDFLTTNPSGPTWIPLTDFGPTSGLNIGSIAVFGRNDDPSQSIIIAGTGEANSTYGIGGNTMQGVGFLLSENGGASWTLLDSTNNSLPFAQRTTSSRKPIHPGPVAGVTTTYKVVVDPRPTPTGGVIIYAALGGLNGGLWRSEDTGIPG